MGLIFMELDPSDAEIPLVHYQHTEECIFVLAGESDITLGDEVYPLEGGDAVYFAGPMLPRLKVRGDKKASYISVITLPIF